MGAGRPRKPGSQHALQGTTAARSNPDQPQYPVTAPEKPAYIAANAVASAEWDRVLPLLLESRVIAHAFRAALENYTLAYADVVAGELVKAQPGFRAVIETDSGVRPHPIVRQVNDARRELRSWAAVLGLLPTSKVQTAPPPAAEDEGDALLARLEGRTGAVVEFRQIQTGRDR